MILESHTSELAESFDRLSDQYTRRLQLHCYQLVGSLQDAEDLCQEALLRAWSRRETLRDNTLVRSWLFRIATNVCLDFLDRRSRRVLPQDFGPPNLGQSTSAPAGEIAWIEPYPTTWLDHAVDPDDPPEIVVERREMVRLAFIAALQHLPTRQRAALILAEVLDWRAREIADALNRSVASVNSALQRARATLRSVYPDGMPDHGDRCASNHKSLLSRYLECWESGDLAGLARLLTEDAVLSMPPTLDWYRGRSEVIRFFQFAWSTEAGLAPFRLIATSANGQPAFGLYGRDPGGSGFRALTVQVLSVREEGVQNITGFVVPTLFPNFGLPLWRE